MQDCRGFGRCSVATNETWNPMTGEFLGSFSLEIFTENLRIGAGFNPRNRESAGIHRSLADVINLAQGSVACSSVRLLEPENHLVPHSRLKQNAFAPLEGECFLLSPSRQKQESNRSHGERVCWYRR